MEHAFAEIIGFGKNYGAVDKPEQLDAALAHVWRDSGTWAVAVAAGDADEPMKVVGTVDAVGQITHGDDDIVSHVLDHLPRPYHGAANSDGDLVLMQQDAGADVGTVDRFDVEAIDEALERLDYLSGGENAVLIERLRGLREQIECFQPDVVLELDQAADSYSPPDFSDAPCPCGDPECNRAWGHE